MKRFLQVINSLYRSKIVVYYDCYSKAEYLTVTITNYIFGCKLSIGNGMYIEENCKKGGILVSLGNIYGYVIFKHGYLLFKNSEQHRFGYKLWENKKKTNKEVSTFCTYIDFNKQNIQEKIELLKNGIKNPETNNT